MLIQAHMQQVSTAVPTAMKKSTIHIEVLPSGLSDDALAYSILFLDTLTTGMLTLLTVAHEEWVCDPAPTFKKFHQHNRSCAAV